MKRHTLPALIAAQLLLAGTSFAAPVAILTRVSGTVEVQRGAQSLPGKSGLALQKGDKVVVKKGSATVFTLGAPPRTLSGGALIVGLTAPRKGSSPSLWRNVYTGLEGGLGKSNRVVAATMRPGEVNLLSPPSGTIESGRPRFEWRSVAPSPRYEIVVWTGNTERLRAQVVGASLAYPTGLPTLSGDFSWQVFPLRQEDGVWVRDAGGSEKNSSKVATTAEMSAVQSDLKKIDATFKTAEHADRVVARAALLRSKGFYEAALREVALITSDATAIRMAQMLRLDLGQTASLGGQSVTVDAAPRGKARPDFLALAPGAPLSYATLKTYIAPDRHFALKIPTNFCVSANHFSKGMKYIDFGATNRGGARVSLVYGPAKNFAGKKTLLLSIKAIIDQVNLLPENKGDSLVVESSAPTSFRGRQARLRNFRVVSGGIKYRGQMLEWSEGSEVFLANYTGGTTDLADAQAIRPLFDTLKLGKAVPPLPKGFSAGQIDIVLQKAQHEHHAFMKRDNAAIELLMSMQGAVAKPGFEKLEKARLATKSGTYQRAQASIQAAKAATRLATELLLKASPNEKTAAQSNRLFKRNQELIKESARAQTAATLTEIKTMDAKLAFWASIVPEHKVWSRYSLFVAALRADKVKLLNQLFKNANSRQRRDTTEMNLRAQQMFEVQRAQWIDNRLRATHPANLHDQQIEVAAAFEALGVASGARADLAGARQYLSRAIAWRRAIPTNYPSRDAYLPLQQSGHIENEIGDADLGRIFYQQAAEELLHITPTREKEISEIKNKEDRRLAKLLWQAARADNCNGLGTTYKLAGEYALAEEQFGQALKILGPTPAKGAQDVLVRMRAAVLNNLFVVRADSGDTEGAAKWLDEASEVARRLDDPWYLANAFSNAANFAYKRSDVEAARRHIRQAREVYQVLGNAQGILDCEMLETELAINAPNATADDREAAVEMAANTFKHAFSLGEARAIVNAGIKLIGAQFMAYDKSDPGFIKEVKDGVDFLKKYDKQVRGTDNYPRLIMLRSQVASLEGKTQEALDLQLSAITLSERIGARSNAREAYAEADFCADLYPRAIELLLKLNRLEDAFDIIARARSKKLRDNLGFSTLSSNDPVLQYLLRRAAALDERVMKTRAQLAEAHAEPPAYRDAEQVKNLEQLLTSTQAEFFSVSAAIKSRNPRFDQALSLSPSQLKKAQKSIPEGALLLQYAPLDDGIYIFAVTNQSLKIFETKVSREKLNSQIRAYRSAMNADIKHIEIGEAVQNIDTPGSPLRQATEQLSEWLLAPVRAEISSSRTVAIVPSGELFYLPFHALGEADKDGKWRFLIEDKPVAYLAKGDVLSIGRDRDLEETNQGILAMGNPVGANLPAAVVEVETIARIFPNSRSLVGTRATKAELLLPASRGKRVLHLAAHGVLNSTQPNQSYIQLSPKSTDDGKLRVGEILGIDLNKVDLVTLSACQTALGEGSPDGTEISSLAQSFSTAGTPSVVASLWNVEDSSTAQLMGAFYGALADGNSKGTALQKAQVTLLSDSKTRHPLFWAPFELLGDWR